MEIWNTLQENTEAFLYGTEDEGETVLRVSMNAKILMLRQRPHTGKFCSLFLNINLPFQELMKMAVSGFSSILQVQENLSCIKLKERPKRLVDRR